jgi:hypothetical protein
VIRTRTTINELAGFEGLSTQFSAEFRCFLRLRAIHTGFSREKQLNSENGGGRA